MHLCTLFLLLIFLLLSRFGKRLNAKGPQSKIFLKALYLSVTPLAGASSPAKLHSLGRLHGRRAVVQAASPPSPRDRWIQENDESRYYLSINSVAGVAGVALSRQTAFWTAAPDFLVGFTPLAFPMTGRPQGSSAVIS